MTSEKLQELKDAYEAVFDKDGNTKLCGRDVCIRLISLMSKYSTANIGCAKTGIMNLNTIKSEYKRIVGE